MDINLKKVSLLLAISSDGLLVDGPFLLITSYLPQFPVALKHCVTFFFKTLFSHFLYKDAKKGDKNEYK